MKPLEHLKSSEISITNGEKAWKSDVAIEVVKAMAAQNYASRHAELWALVPQNYAGANSYKGNKLSDVNADFKVIGLIDTIDGTNFVYAWSVSREDGETWEAFVERSKQKSIEMISRPDVVDDVMPELKDKLYYNLNFISEKEYKKPVVRTIPVKKVKRKISHIPLLNVLWNKFRNKVEIDVGGVYSVSRAQGTFGVIKVLAYDSTKDCVYVRIYSSKTPKPLRLDPNEYTSKLLENDFEIAIGVLPITTMVFNFWKPQLLFKQSISEDEDRNLKECFGLAKPWNDLKYP